jgi:predicted patatin/cPLA2 family phospholipase
MLQATCAIPFMFPPIRVNGQDYYDGGIVEPITIKKAEEDGFKKHIVVRTREPGFVRTQEKSNIYAAKVLRRKYPNLVPHILGRHEKYNAISEHIDELERRGDAIVLRPDHALASLEKDMEKLRAGYRMGYDQATARMDEIREFCGLKA